MQGAQAKFSMSAERSGQQDLAGSSGWSDSTKQDKSNNGLLMLADCIQHSGRNLSDMTLPQ
jgi:hypothetical protein